MPRVPTYDSFQATSNALPVSPIRASEVPDVAGQQTQRMAQGLMQAGGVVSNFAAEQLNAVNQLRIDDSVNKAKETAIRLQYGKDSGFANLRGVDAVSRPGGLPLADEYGTQLKDELANIAEGLSSEVQRQAFSLRSNEILGQFRAQAIRHEAEQGHVWANSVDDGTLRNRMNSVGVNYDNPTEIDAAINGRMMDVSGQSVLIEKGIKQAVYDLGVRNGKAAEWIEAEQRKQVSNAHKVALSIALEKGNIDYADAYLKRYGKDMEPDDALHAMGLITKETDMRTAVSVATSVLRSVSPKLFTSDSDRAFNILLESESSNQQFDKEGQPRTSPKGAVGIAQVLPGTAKDAAKMAGLPWDKQRYHTDPEYNKALGKAYFQAQLQAFGGNLEQTYAAYNAGPAATQAAIKTANAEGGDWLAYLPKETQGYVNKNMSAYGTGGGQYQRPTLQDVHNMVREQVGDQRPGRLKLALEEATRQYEGVTKAIKQREDDSVANAMRELLQNGGRVSQLSPSLRANIPPNRVDTVLNFGARIAKGEDITNPAVYQRLATSPDTLRKLSDSEFFALRKELNEADFKHFANERAELISGKKKVPAESLNRPAINTVLNDRLRTLGLDPTPKDGTPKAMHLGAVRSVVDEALLSAQSAAGKQFGDAEVAKFIDGMFATSQNFRNLVLGIKSAVKPERLLTMSASDIPTEIKDKLIKDFEAAGVSRPTDGELLNRYWQFKFTQKRASASGGW